MYSYVTKASALKIGILATLITFVSHPANAQDFNNFVDFNQSRQFFDEGNGTIEREIKRLQQDLKLPQIKIPQHSYRSQDIQKSNSFYAEAQLQPMSKKAVVDDDLFSCSLWQTEECDRTIVDSKFTKIIGK